MVDLSEDNIPISSVPLYTVDSSLRLGRTEHVTGPSGLSMKGVCGNGDDPPRNHRDDRRSNVLRSSSVGRIQNMVPVRTASNL